MNKVGEARISEILELDNKKFENLERFGPQTLFNKATIKKLLTPAKNGYPLGCVDEGFPYDGIRWPGSGCLESDEDMLVEQIGKSSATKLTTHIECGAWQKRQAQNPSSETVLEWGMRIAKKCNLPYEHIQKLERNPKFHHARVIYYSSVNLYLRPLKHVLPDGFVISANHFSQAQSSLWLCIEIACGSHGFRTIHPQSNLWIIAIGKPGNPRFGIEKLCDDAKKIANEYASKQKIIIEHVEIL